LSQNKDGQRANGIIGGRITPAATARHRPRPFEETCMKRLLAIAFASIFALSAHVALAADAPKDAAKDAAAAKKPALEKPANVTAEAWAKMSDAEKQKAAEAAKKDAGGKKKEKKGGC
jgi:hypothetical protein